MANVASRFRIDFTADFYTDQGQLRYQDVGLGQLSNIAGIEVGRFREHQQEITPEQLVGVQGVVVLAPRVTARSLASAQDLLAIARFGVGYDSVDVAACTAADVVLCIAAGAVDHSVAEATVGWMLSLTHHMSMKDRIVRDGRWNDRDGYMGSELRDRTLGIIGFGGIGRAVARMLSGFRMQKPLVFDPALTREEIEAEGARAASLDELLSQSDFVSLHCPLNNRTRNLIGPRELSLMPRHAYLLNTARGGIIDEDALFQALKTKQIAGAALDCFVGEPLTKSSRFAELENVILAPHSIAWTNELFRDIGHAACLILSELAQGRRPRGIVNPEVFDRPTFQAKWQRLQLKK